MTKIEQIRNLTSRNDSGGICSWLIVVDCSNKQKYEWCITMPSSCVNNSDFYVQNGEDDDVDRC